MRGRIALGALIAALAVALLGLLVSRSISGRMRAIKRGAERFAAGDFAHEILVTDTDEIGEVAVGLNAMGRQLSETIQTITGERNEREAVLAGMTEGVLAVDGEERVITINAAAAGLLGVEPEQAHGRSIQEVVRNPDLQAFVAAVLAGEGPRRGRARRPRRAGPARAQGARRPARRRRRRRRRRQRRGRRAERRHPHAALRSDQARLRGQRLARDQDAGHDDQGLRRDAARRRPRRPRRRRAVPAHHRGPGRPSERHHRRPAQPVEPRERRRRRGDHARARQHPRRPAGRPRRLRDEGRRAGRSR